MRVSAVLESESEIWLQVLTKIAAQLTVSSHVPSCLPTTLNRVTLCPDGPGTRKPHRHYCESEAVV